MKIGFLGGSFDPVHLGHVRIAQAALSVVDQVYFIPASQTPLKSHTPIAAVEDRLNMLKLAIKDQQNFGIVEWELEQPGPNYTIDTVTYLKKRFPGADLYWILGADQVAQLDQWKDIDVLKSQIQFLGFQRPGAEDLGENDYSIKRLNLPAMDISSTQIRDWIGMEDLAAKASLGPQVYQYILENRLYSV